MELSSKLFNKIYNENFVYGHNTALEKALEAILNDYNQQIKTEKQ